MVVRLAFLFLSLSLFAAEKNERVAVWISELSHENYRVRDDAEDMLGRQAEAAYLELKKTLLTKPDAETRLRAERVVRKIETERIWESRWSHPESALDSRSGSLTLSLERANIRSGVQTDRYPDGRTYETPTLTLAGFLKAEPHLAIVAYREMPLEVLAVENETGAKIDRCPKRDFSQTSDPAQVVPFYIPFQGDNLPKKVINRLDVKVEVMAVGGFSTMKVPLRSRGEFSEGPAYVFVREINKVEGNYELVLDAGTDLMSGELDRFVKNSIVIRDQSGATLNYVRFELPPPVVEPEEPPGDLEEGHFDFDGEFDRFMPSAPVDPYLRLRISLDDPDQVPTELEMTHPRFVSKRIVPFVFTDIEIP